MKKNKYIFAVVVLVLASLACQTIMGGADSSTPDGPFPPIDNSGDTPTEESSDFSFGGDSEFPMPADATNVVNIAGTTNFQTKLSLDDVMAFYRDEYGKQGLTERDLLTVVSGGVFSIVFDGDPSGKAVVIQGVDLGDDSVNVTITLQDV